MSDDGPRRRKGPRIEAAFRVRYPTVDQLVIAYTQDLSKGGMFLRTARYLPTNAVIRLYIELPDHGGEVTIIARVVYVRDDAAAKSSGRPSGMGIQFLDLERGASQRIEEFISAVTEIEAEKSAPISVGRSLNVVVADDDEAVREMVGGVFRRRGDRVRTTGDGLAALAQLLKDPPDVLLSDVQMPRMDGWQLLRMIRARPSLVSIPVVFLTTLSSEEDRLRGYQIGVDDYLSKPFNEGELVIRVDRLVARIEKERRRDKKSLRGDLTQVALCSVLSFLELERKTGVLLVVGDRSGRMYLKDGRPLRVEVDDVASPAEAVAVFLAFERGQFEFAAQDVTAPDEMGTSVTALLLEHARAVDESHR